MAGEEELRARAVLAEMQMRISMGPYAALSIPETASAEEVRAAFLDLTKQFHPARFGRMSSDVHRLANEVFLGIKAAHDQLVKMLGSSGRAPVRSSTAPVVGSQTGGTVRGTGLVPRTNANPSQPAARGTDRPTTRPSTPVMQTPSGGVPRPTTPSGARAPSPPVQSTQPLPRTPTPAAGVPVRFGTPPSEAGEKRLTPPSGIPTQRPASPVNHTPAQPRPTSPLPTNNVRPTPTRTPAPELINPPTIRYSGIQPAAGAASSSQAIPRQGAPTEEQMLEHAMNLLSSKDYTAARSAFHALAAKVPQSRKYRALLCYARGRETLATGRKDDAVLEFQRALQLDPELEIASEAIREAQRKSRW